MPENNIRDIQKKRKSDITIAKEFPVVVRGKKPKKPDIGPGKKQKVIIERKKTNKKNTIDLTGHIKEQITGVQPDIRGPHHRFRIRALLRNISSPLAEAWRRLPGWATWTIGTCVVCLASVLFLFMFQYRLTSLTYSNYLRLFSLSESKNVSREIRDIAHDFASLRRNFRIVNIIANNPFVSNEKVVAAHYIIDGGTELALALDQGYELAVQIQDIFHESGKQTQLTPWLKRKESSFVSIAKHLHNANNAYASIDPQALGDDDLIATFEEKKIQLEQASHMMTYIAAHFDGFVDMLGDSEPKTILILNQNQDELRAGGGFPGSAAILRLYKGLPESWEMKDIYALDWSLLAKEVPPEGINQFRAAPGSSQVVDFGIRDANYYPTFEESAHKINALMQEAGFESVDLVIGINQSLITDILKVTGPIRVPEIDSYISDENFNIIISSLVESKTFAVNSPKDILFSFGEHLFEDIQTKGYTAALANIAYDQVRTGEVLVASTDPSSQDLIDGLGIFEQWGHDQGDWIYPIFTSVSKNKSDRHMQRDFVVTYPLKESCLRNIQIIQKHAYDLQTDIQIEKLYYELGLTSDLEALKHVQGKGDNKQYMRLLLPQGSKLVDANGFDLEEEVGDTFTKISWYQTTRTGTTSSVDFVYEVPSKVCNGPTWMYKQPGLERVTYTLVRPGFENESHDF